MYRKGILRKKHLPIKKQHFIEQRFLKEKVVGVLIGGFMIWPCHLALVLSAPQIVKLPNHSSVENV